MHGYKNHFDRLRGALAASVVALLAAAPVLAAETATPAAAGFEPTMADYQGIYDALQRYRMGVQKHDQALERSAFWDEARRGGGGGGGNAGPPPGGQGPNAGPPPDGQPGPNAGAPPGAGGPPGAAGQAGRGRGAPPNFDELRKMPGFVEVWHLPLDSYIHFESPTRARHYEYFLSTYPQPEKKMSAEELAKQPNASTYRTSILGWPGHYDDILEKRNGEWRILQRKMGMNSK